MCRPRVFKCVGVGEYSEDNNCFCIIFMLWFLTLNKHR